MDPFTILAAGSALVGLFGAKKAADSQKEAYKAQAEQRRKETLVEEISVARDRRKLAMQARAARASMVNTATQTGLGGSSGLLAGQSSLANQYGVAVGQQNANIGFANSISATMQEVANAQQDASNYAGMSNLAFSVAGGALSYGSGGSFMQGYSQGSQLGGSINKIALNI